MQCFNYCLVIFLWWKCSWNVGLKNCSLAGEKFDQASLSHCIKYWFLCVCLHDKDVCCATVSCLKLATETILLEHCYLPFQSCDTFFWCRNEQFQEELWKITVDRLKMFLSPNILEKYGPTQTTTDQSETAEEATGNVRVGVGRRGRGWEDGGKGPKRVGEWRRGQESWTTSATMDAVAWSGSHTVQMDLGTRQLKDVINYSTVCM